MRFGVSYYPELVDEREWRRDLENMRAARFSVIRMLEFAWIAIEPREGEYDFDWLDRFVELAHGMGFELILCTPTATPPAWLSTQYPEIMVQLRDGSRQPHGGRRDVDVDSEILHHYTREICTALGQRYGQHPAVLGWQIDNELMGPEGLGLPPESHTRATTFRFRQYLKHVHGDLATLNRRWGARFWSQAYSAWSEITTPLSLRSTMGQVLDYSRYFSQSQVAYIRLQYAALRAVIAPHQFITHNSTGVFGRGIDHTDYAAELDVAGWDAYPGAAGRPHPRAFAALAHDLFRSAKHRPFWVLETAPINRGVTPAFFAEMRAHGAEAVILWHWRSHRANAEQRNDAFCDYAGEPWADRVEFMHRLADRPELRQDLPRELPCRRAAILYCIDATRTRLTPDTNLKRAEQEVGYGRVLIETYRALWQMGVAVDLVRPGDSLEGYELLAMPSARLLGEEDADLIRRFVQRGGTLLGVAKTAHQDRWGAFYPRLGEPLADVLGFTARRDFQPDEPLTVMMNDGQRYECLLHAENLLVSTAQVHGRFEGGGVFDGAPAALTHELGQGKVFYAAGCAPELIHRLAQEAAAHAGIETIELGKEVAVLPALTGNGVWVFNHGTQELVAGGTTLPPGDFALLPSAEALKHAEG